MERVAVVNVLRQQVHAVEHYPLVVGQRAGTGPIVEQGDVKAGRLVLNGRSKVSGHVSVVRMTRCDHHQYQFLRVSLFTTIAFD